MAMSMQEFFYGESEPAYFAHYGRQTSIPYSEYCHQVVPQAAHSGQMVSSFDLMVPMCCAGCEDQVQEALLGLRGVRDVACDRYNQRVTITGNVDPVQALKRVKNVGAPLGSRSSYSTQRYESNSSSPGSHCAQQNIKEYASYADHYNRSSSNITYSRTHCPVYREESGKTNYVSANPTTATRVEIEC